MGRQQRDHHHRDMRISWPNETARAMITRLVGAPESPLVEQREAVGKMPDGGK